MTAISTAATALSERPDVSTTAAPFDPRRVRATPIGPARLLRGLDDASGFDNASGFDDVPGFDDGSGLDWDTHRRSHGDRPSPGNAELLRLLSAAGLTGRGGAGFPLADKISALRRGRPVVVVNGAEGEPGSAKDAVLLARVPHLVLDGAAVVADAIGARRAIVAVTDPIVERLVRGAVGQRPDAARFEVRRVPARFIAGEGRTLVRVLSGGPQLPPGRRVHATEHGVDGAPTLLANAETFAHVGLLARTGPPAPVAGPGSEVSDAWAETGTTLLSVTGAVARPGVVEVPIGLRLGELAAHVGAHPSPFVVIGGYHGAWLDADPALVLSRPALRAAGGTLGAGTVMFVGADTCAPAELGRVADWLAGESARQCGPCAFGLPSLAAQLRATPLDGRARPPATSTWRQLGQLPGRGACAHPDGSARFLASGLARIEADLSHHRTHNHSRGGPSVPEVSREHVDRGDLATDRTAAFTPRTRS